MPSRWPGRPDRVIDLDGALVIPGFVDAHVHTTDAGLALAGLDLSGTRSLAAVPGRRPASSPRPIRTVCCGGTAGRRRGGRRTARRPAREIDEAVGNRPDLPVQGGRALGAGQHCAGRPRSPTARDWPAGRTPGRSPSWPTRPCEPLPGNNSHPRSEPRRNWPSCESAAANGIVEVHECGAGGRHRPGRPGRAAGAGRPDPGARLSGRRGHRPGAGQRAAGANPVRTPSAATWSSTGRSAPGPPPCTGRTRRCRGQPRRAVPDRAADRRSPGGLHPGGCAGRFPRDR